MSSNKNIGFLVGILGALVVLFLPNPENLSIEAHRAAFRAQIRGSKGKYLEIIDQKQL